MSWIDAWLTAHTPRPEVRVPTDYPQVLEEGADHELVDILRHELAAPSAWDHRARQQETKARHERMAERRRAAQAERWIEDEKAARAWQRAEQERQQAEATTEAEARRLRERWHFQGTLAVAKPQSQPSIEAP